MLRLLLVALSLLAAPSQSNDYDEQIRKASGKYLPEWHWLWWKAQLQQESLLDPSARSPVGAAGIAQFMPGTCQEVFPQMGWACDPYDADKSIHAGAFYMKRLRRVFRAPRPESDRRKWAQASYNRGVGNILKDQKRCGNAMRWEDTVPCVPKEETINYIIQIERRYDVFKDN